MNKAVITGDIVHSGKLNADDKMYLAKALKKTLKIWDKDFDMKSEMYRGDSFQCLVYSLSNSLRVAILLKTFIKSLNPSQVYDIYSRENPEKVNSRIFSANIFDVRISVGIGPVDFEMKSVATSDGVAFNISGSNLDKIKGTKQSLIIGSDDEFSAELETEIVLLDNILSRATALQCEVINLKALGYTEVKIANMLKIRQSAVNQRSVSAGWNAIDTLLKRFESIYG
jgi:hypothetical protein